jgi:hypothetical protein
MEEMEVVLTPADQDIPRPSPLNNLLVFKDQPLFADPKAIDETDAFNHEAFAETILELIKRNVPPLSIGLFGAWGIGKSTIINILFRKLAEHESLSFKPIYFNAWKYSGDSFRRQFLIEVARQVYGKDHHEVLRLAQLNYADVLKRQDKKGIAGALKQAYTDTIRLRFALRGTAIVRFLMGCASLLITAMMAGFIFAHHALIATLLLTTVGPAIFVWFSQIKFEDLFVFQEAPLYDPKLIFPEQFENEFTSLIGSVALRNKKVVIAIDDLDRCEPGMVQDVLISMKNFIGQEKCFFIIPCDDKTIVAVFTEPNQMQGYSDESLRKYFNVVLRIPPITSTDLVDFANTMARKTGIPEDVVQVAVLANCRDARKMKHFLNSLAMKYQIAKAREAAGLLPEIVDNSLLELAKAVLIEDAYPDLFAKIVENPRVYQVLERAALGPEDETGELKSLGLDDWTRDYPGLREVLERTRDIPMIHADVFFSLKSTNPEVKIPRGTELKAAIIGGTSGVIDEITKGITDEAARTATADLLVDLLNRSTGRFLRFSITGALKLYNSNLFSQGDGKRVASTVSSALLHRDTVGILVQPPDAVLRSAEESGTVRLSEMLNKYESAISDLKTPSPPTNILQLISSIYRFPSERSRFAALFNSKFEAWIRTQEGITALEKLDLPPDLTPQERIPSRELADKILGAIIPEAAETSNNEIRRKILFAAWSEDYGAPFLKTLTTLLQGSQALTSYSPEMRFAIESLNIKNELVGLSDANHLWPLLPPLYDRLTDSLGKFEVSKTAVAFAVLSNEASVRTAAQTFLLGFWRTLSDPALRASLAFVESFALPEAQALTKAALEQELSTATNERQAPTDRTKQRVAICIENRSALAPNAVEDTLVKALEADQDGSLSTWLEVIGSSQSVLSADFAERIADRCLVLARPNASRPSRLDLLLRKLTETLGRLAPDKRGELARQYFDLLKDPDENLRNAAAGTLAGARKSLPDKQEFRIPLTKTLQDLRRQLGPRDLAHHRPVIEALVAQSDLFGRLEWQDVADMSKRLMSEPETALQEFGISLAEKISNVDLVPEDIQGELVHLLATVESSSPTLAERATRRLDEWHSNGLSDLAKDVLEKRRAPGS